MKYDLYASQTQGARNAQEDDFGFVDTSLGILAAVADGLGGHPWGELASKLAITACLQHAIEKCDSKDNTPNELLAGAIARAQESIVDLCAEVPRYRKMGTTLATIYIKDEHIYRGWVGDSLIFRIRAGEIQSLGTPWGMGSVWTQALMFGQGCKPCGLDEGLAIHKGDRYLLATDGIAVLELDDINQCMAKASKASEAASELITRVQDKADPHQDNCTAVCLFVS